MRRLRAVRASAGGSETGAALVEFAMVVPLLVPLLVILMQFGVAFNYKNQLTQLAAEGARMAAVDRNPGDSTALTLQNYIRSQAVGQELKNGGTTAVPDPIRVCITPGSTAGDPVTVTASVTFHWLPIVNSDVTQTTITGSATMRMEQLASKYALGCSPA